jgi:hypothetical protein
MNSLLYRSTNITMIVGELKFDGIHGITSIVRRLQNELR